MFNMQPLIAAWNQPEPGRAQHIETKAEFYDKWMRLEFGNRIRMWPTLAELQSSGYVGLVSVRNKNPSSPHKAYYVPAADIPALIDSFVAQGALLADFAFNESTPDDRLRIQGEAQYLPGGLHLTYSRDKVAMRQAMERPLAAQRLEAIGILRDALRPASYDMMAELFDRYPDSVIEFGAYEHALGVLPGHNCVIWEVRDY